MTAPAVTSVVDLRLTALKGEALDGGARRLARRLRISEAELVASRVGGNVVRLDRPAELLKAVPRLGVVLAVTRNEHVIHEKVGRYDDVSIGPERGMVFNHDIDLRLVMRQWCHAFAVTFRNRSSLQFFDSRGKAVHKIWMLEESAHAAFREIVDKFADRDQKQPWQAELIEVPEADEPDERIDREALHAHWAALQDTHDFNRLLRTFDLGRLQALRLIGSDFAFQVSPNAARQILLSTAATGTPIIVFVGNAGCIQIHTGPVVNIASSGHRWLKIVDPLFRLRLREDQIGSSWVVRKPTRDYMLTSLEIYDSGGQLMVQFFGAREPGMPEREGWRNTISRLPIQAD